MLTLDGPALGGESSSDKLLLDFFLFEGPGLGGESNRFLRFSALGLGLPGGVMLIIERSG